MILISVTELSNSNIEVREYFISEADRPVKEAELRSKVATGNTIVFRTRQER